MVDTGTVCYNAFNIYLKQHLQIACLVWKVATFYDYIHRLPRNSFSQIPYYLLITYLPPYTSLEWHDAVADVPAFSVSVILGVMGSWAGSLPLLPHVLCGRPLLPPLTLCQHPQTKAYQIVVCMCALQVRGSFGVASVLIT